MRRALADGKIKSSTVDYVNAHGTGTKLGDVGELIETVRGFGYRFRGAVK